ncbi:MAG TPA: radical SAM protein [Firmicutes bacterium]|nr:radical SAM protein [Bacillota bacterium]
MFAGFDVAKRFFGEKILTQVLYYLRHDPKNNVPRMFDLVSKAAIMPNHRDTINSVKSGFESNTNMKQLIDRILEEIDPKILQQLSVIFLLNAILVGIPKQRRLAEKFGFEVPWTILIDPTSNCNLRCRGCWAGAYEKHHSLSFEEVDRIIEEAKEMGIYFFVLSGGEPFMWPHLFELADKHADVAFMPYTNGTLIDRTVAKKIREVGNISPAISIEGGREATDWRRGRGTYDKVMAAMDNLKENGMPFGVSLTVTRRNCEELFSDEFIDLLISKGAFYGWSFHYIPIGMKPDFSLMITPEQRAALVDRVRHIRTTKPIMIADFWNDGQYTEGCIAGGRRYFHINAHGDVEPCAFIHFAVDKIHGKSLKQILANPLFKAYQQRIPFSDNMLRPCPLIDNPGALREIVAETGARPTHEGADTTLKGEAAKQMDCVACAWKKVADQKWEEIKPQAEKAVTGN